ncbi:MAG: 1,4-dihydroxy-2-naphthoate polyprenyltransferase [Ignavibacteriales bacterium]|nr:MAG: 1,4-dihydroxy-2-naphthoate polyprenyltransferase [Ignavibacteriales bacterium]
MLEANVHTPTKIESWLLASRPKTLPAAIVPVLIGSALAYSDGSFQVFTAIITLICSLLIQIATNFTNDLYDFLKGTDKKDRSGPTRVVTAGLITPTEMKYGVILTFGLSFILGLYLVSIGGWLILLIGVISILAGFAYTAGPYPLAYNGLGDIFVFIFFGLIGTVGTYYVQTQQISPLAFWSSIPVGALITNILVVNNYRDTDEDRLSGKRTLSVIFGKRFARLQYVFFMIISYLILVVVYFTFKQEVWIFLPVLTFPVSLKLIKMIYTLEGKELNSTLALTAKLSAMYAVLFSIGILL